MFNDIAYDNLDELMDLMERAGLPKVTDETWHNNITPSVSTTIGKDFYEVFVPDNDEVYTYLIWDEEEGVGEFDDPRDVVDFLKKI